MIKIGVANYNGNTSGNSKPKRNYFTLVVGDNFYRILPPCFSYAENGRWAEHYSVHFGYRGSKNDKGNAPLRPFVCVRRKDKNKNIIQECAEHVKIEKAKALLDKKRSELVEKGKSKEEIKTALQPITDYLMAHNVDNKWHLNVKASDGRIGVLKIPHSAYQDLLETIKNVIDRYKIDPLSPNQGVWFNFKRMGAGLDTTYKVQVQMKMIDTPQGKAEVLKEAELSESDLARMEAEAFDLSNMYSKITPEQVQHLVDTDGDPSVVDQIFALPTRVTQEASPASTASEESPETDLTRSQASVSFKPDQGKGVIEKMSLEEFKKSFGSWEESE